MHSTPCLQVINKNMKSTGPKFASWGARLVTGRQPARTPSTTAPWDRPFQPTVHPQYCGHTGHLVQKDVVRDSIKSFAEILNTHICCPPFAFEVGNLVLKEDLVRHDLPFMNPC